MLNEPFDYGLDANGLPRFAFNVLVDKHASDTFVYEVIAILVAAGVGVYGKRIFNGSKAARPDTKEAVLMVVETGGSGAERIHNSPIPAYRKPTAQFVASAEKASDARAMALRAWNALAAVSNASVTPVTV